MSSISIASPILSIIPLRAAASASLKPSTVSTFVGKSYLSLIVSGKSKEASLLSTGLITYFFMLFISSSVKSPSKRYTFAVLIYGLSPCEIS